MPDDDSGDGWHSSGRHWSLLRIVSERSRRNPARLVPFRIFRFKIAVFLYVSKFGNKIRIEYLKESIRIEKHSALV